MATHRTARSRMVRRTIVSISHDGKKSRLNLSLPLPEAWWLGIVATVIVVGLSFSPELGAQIGLILVQMVREAP